MNKKIVNMIIVLFATFVAIGLNSCDGESNYYDPNSQLDEFNRIFENMKSSYAGTYTTPLNTKKTVKYNIDSQANVNVATFPMDAVMEKLCGGEYQYANLSGDALTFSCPIDSVGYSAGYLTFKTKEDLEHNKLDFSYTFKDVKHTGYMYLTVKGTYDPQKEIITTNFIVTDLIVDNHDYTSQLCPIDNVIEATKVTVSSDK